MFTNCTWSRGTRNTNVLCLTGSGTQTHQVLSMLREGATVRVCIPYTVVDCIYCDVYTCAIAVVPAIWKYVRPCGLLRNAESTPRSLANGMALYK